MLPEITFKPCCDSPKLATSVEPVMSRKQRTLLFQKLTDRHYLASQGIVVRTDITGISFEIPVNFDMALERIAKTICRQLGLSVTSLHSIRIRHYRGGDSHPPHCDHYERESDHLLATSIINIASAEKGGKTCFTAAPYAQVNQLGHATLWFNLLSDGTPDFNSEHKGEEVLQGEKLIAILLFYAPPQQADKSLAQYHKYVACP